MAITPEKLKMLILSEFPHSDIQLDDMLGDADHYGLTLVSEIFEGLNRVQRHQKIYAALGPIMGNELHALSIRTRTPKEHQQILETNKNNKGD